MSEEKKGETSDEHTERMRGLFAQAKAERDAGHIPFSGRRPKMVRLPIDEIKKNILLPEVKINTIKPSPSCQERLPGPAWIELAGEVE